jgi:hypothetical protein
MDFVMDALANGRRLKCLTIVDDFTRECLDIPVDHGISQVGLRAIRDNASCARVRSNLDDNARRRRHVERLQRFRDGCARSDKIVMRDVCKMLHRPTPLHELHLNASNANTSSAACGFTRADVHERPQNSPRLAHFAFDPPDSFRSWRGWIASPCVSLTTGAFFCALLAHAWVGVRDVIMDYLATTRSSTATHSRPHWRPPVSAMRMLPAWEDSATPIRGP